MREGAMGLSSSLIYAPDNFADTEELVALAAAAHQFGGTYVSHIRSEGDQLESAVEEIIAIGRRTGMPVQIYHMKPAGTRNWPKSAAMIRRLWEARSQGIDITGNIYPYTAAGTGLNATMPLWVQEGGHEAWLKRLKDPNVRARVVREMRSSDGTWENAYQLAGGPENITLIGARSPRLKPLIGKTIAEIASERGKAPEETIIDLVIEDEGPAHAAYVLMSEENIRRNIAWPWTMVGSDGDSIAPEPPFIATNPHPRAYGSFARFLGKYVREEKVISLPEAIRRLTALPAAQLKLRGRGRIAPGYFADIVIFDPDRIADRATYANPHQYSVGVRDVLVNGVPVLRKGAHTGAKPGRIVRGPGWSGWPRAR
jgi:N-acyl-D-amino-acid deacylase